VEYEYYHDGGLLMDRESYERVLHPVTFRVLRSLMLRSASFSDLLSSTGSDATTLMDVVTFLCEIGAVEKEDGEYAITEKGYTILRLIEGLIEIVGRGAYGYDVGKQKQRARW